MKVNREGVARRRVEEQKKFIIQNEWITNVYRNL